MFLGVSVSERNENTDDTLQLEGDRDKVSRVNVLGVFSSVAFCRTKYFRFSDILEEGFTSFRTMNSIVVGLLMLRKG